MTSPLQIFKQGFAKAVVESQGLSPDLTPKIEAALERPREEGRGDLALPCFALAKALGDNPVALAQKIAEKLAGHERFTAVAEKAFVNVTVSTRELAEAVIPLARAERYGGSDEGRGKTVVIDFSSPNIAKPLAFHHIRSTVIGAAIGRIHRALGWNVVGINYLGDWGKQFGLLATGFQRHGDPARRADAKHLVEVYVKANQEADVAGLKATIARPDEARKLIGFLAQAEEKLAKGEGDKKKLEKDVAKLEKKLEEMGCGADREAWLADLDAAKQAAEARLPEAEARDREARLFLKRMEEKDEAALAEWHEFRQTSIADFERVYARMGIEFTAIEGESRYQDVLEATVARVREKPGTKESDGAEIVDMPEVKGEPPVILKTRDGTTLYATRDIAAAMDRHERFGFARSLYVVAADQALHFRQLFRTLGAMGFEWAERMKHVDFGRIHGMSTRRGKVIFLDEVLDLAVEKAKEKALSSEKIEASLVDQISEAVGIGAVVFRDLKANRRTDYTFSWDEVLDFSGESGPSVQYSHARVCSILRKAGGVPVSADLGRLVLDEERALILALSRFPEAVAKAAEWEELEPSNVTRAVLEIAKATASYLTAGNRDRSMRVLVEDDAELRAARLFLIDAVRNTLRIGLELLGVRAPEAM